MIEKMYTVRMTSRALGLQERTIREWIRNGKINAVKYEGSRVWHIPENEIKRVARGDGKC